MRSLAFKPRFDRIDAVIKRAALRNNPNADSMERAVNEPAAALIELFPPPANSFPRHYGAVTKSRWVRVDEVFKPADLPEDCPVGFQAKSVQVADVYEAPITTNVRTAFLVLWASQEAPVMVPCPEVPADLLEPPEGSRLELSRNLLRVYVEEICDRLNVIAPAALLLGASDDHF